MASGEGSAGLSPEVRAIVSEELERCREQVLERITKARKLTDSEVYAAGVALSEVVKRAQAYMTDVNARLTTTAESEDGIDAALGAISRIAKTQEDLVSKALENLAGIAKAGRQIQEMSGASRLLALNARVESSRFGGEGGRAFNVIADEMRELSQSVETTNTMVSKLAAQLQKSLPEIQAQTHSMSTSIQGLAREMATRNERLQALFRESIAAGGVALEGVLSSARSGLSHLQFQDLMIQDLEGIERVLMKTHQSVAKAIDPEASPPEASGSSRFLGTLGAELDEAAPAASNLEAGEVMLF